jgi:ABC-type amino acid transport substrate-binding protein
VKDLDSASVTIGTFTGTGTYQAVSKAHPQAKYDLVVQGPGQSLRIDDLLIGRIDVAPFDSPLGYVLEAQYPQVKIVPGGGASCVKGPDVPTPSGLAVPQGDAVFTAFVRDVVTQMQNSGEMTQLLAKFSSPEYMHIGK